MSLRHLVLALILACLGCPGLGHADTAAINLVYDTNENPPLTYGVGTDTDPYKPGIIIDLLHMAADHAGIPITLTRVPWARGLNLVEAGETDGIFMSSYTEDRLRYGVYPMKDGKPDTNRKLTDMSYWLYVPAGSAVTWDGKAIAGLTGPIGATTGFAIVPMLRAMGLTVIEDPIHLRNLHKLESGEIAAYAELQAHIDAMIRANPTLSQSIRRIEPALRTTPYYLMFSKSFYGIRPADAERLWDAIAWVNDQTAFHDMIVRKYSD